MLAEWFQHDAEHVAPALLGCVLQRTLADGTILEGVISETEAYVGPEDLASHAAGGRRTDRNESMWARPGTSYVYFTYGMHHCFNVSCLQQDHPAAVLIRAVIPTVGIDRMRALRSIKPRKHPLKDRDLANGPGKLCQALDIDLGLNGVDLTKSTQLTIRSGRKIPFASFEQTPRVGIPSAGEWTHKPLRWVMKVDPIDLSCEKMQQKPRLFR